MNCKGFSLCLNSMPVTIKMRVDEKKFTYSKNEEKLKPHIFSDQDNGALN